MPNQQRINPITIPAHTDLSAYLFHFVTVDNVGELELTGAGGAADGVLQDRPDAQGAPAAVQPLDGAVSDVVVGGTAATLTAGDLVASDGNGAAITAIPAILPALDPYVLGRALKTGTTGQVVPVLLGSKARP